MSKLDPMGEQAKRLESVKKGNKKKEKKEVHFNNLKFLSMFRSDHILSISQI